MIIIIIFFNEAEYDVMNRADWGESEAEKQPPRSTYTFVFFSNTWKPNSIIVLLFKIQNNDMLS